MYNDNIIIRIIRRRIRRRKKLFYFYMMRMGALSYFARILKCM